MPISAAAIEGPRSALFTGTSIAIGCLRALRRPNVIKTLDRITGSLFIAFGLRLAASRA